MLLKEERSAETDIEYKIEYSMDDYADAQTLSRDIIEMCVANDVTLRELAILKKAFPREVDKAIENSMGKTKVC